MSKPVTIRISPADHLSIIHKATNGTRQEPEYFQDAIIQTDLSFKITGWNPIAELLHQKSGAMGKNIFELIDIHFLDSSLEILKADLAQKGCWTGEVIFTRYDGHQVHFRSTASYIINDKDQPIAVLIVNHTISHEKTKEKQLAEAEKKYETLLNTLPDGVVMINADGKIAACNRKGAELLGLREEEYLGLVVASPSWKAIKEDGSEFPSMEFPAMVSLQTGFPQRNVKMGIQHPNGMFVWLSVNSQALIRPGEFEPYAAVVSYSDITEAMKNQKELQRSNERFFHAGRVTSDTIWDIDLETNEIYRSEAFHQFSGYTNVDIQPNLDWWFNKIHPEDRERVRTNINEAIRKGITFWQDEYRFLCADGTYKHLLDKGVHLNRKGKPARMVGAIQDLTERKKLEARLLHEEIQKQKQVTQASIIAQEQERNNISKELHDNVNQILMSVKLFIDTAKRDPDEADDLLDKAIEYQLLALEEIRKLSKTLSNSLVKTVGLEESVADLVYNMKKLQQLEVNFQFSSGIEEKLSNDQKLMLFRVIQEQTTNIIKYAEAYSVKILIKEENDIVHLLICDDGKGFDTAKKEGKGIGFLNIVSRADAYNGKVNIISAPGAGCTLELSLPLHT